MAFHDVRFPDRIAEGPRRAALEFGTGANGGDRLRPVALPEANCARLGADQLDLPALVLQRGGGDAISLGTGEAQVALRQFGDRRCLLLRPREPGAADVLHRLGPRLSLLQRGRALADGLRQPALCRDLAIDVGGEVAILAGGASQHGLAHGGAFLGGGIAALGAGGLLQALHRLGELARGALAGPRDPSGLVLAADELLDRALGAGDAGADLLDRVAELAVLGAVRRGQHQRGVA